MGVILLLFHAISHSCSFPSVPPHTRINIVASVSLCLCGSVGGEEHCLQEEEDVRRRERKRKRIRDMRGWETKYLEEQSLLVQSLIRASESLCCYLKEKIYYIYFIHRIFRVLCNILCTRVFRPRCMAKYVCSTMHMSIPINILVVG